jgi:hypothetical protein
VRLTGLLRYTLGTTFSYPEKHNLRQPFANVAVFIHRRAKTDSGSELKCCVKYEVSRRYGDQTPMKASDIITIPYLIKKKKKYADLSWLKNCRQIQWHLVFNLTFKTITRTHDRSNNTGYCDTGVCTQVSYSKMYLVRYSTG